MTTFNTGNPIGSTDARDRLDNSENMDILENSTTLNAHPDRLGVMRKTRKGMELEHDNQISAHEAEHDAQISAHELEHDNQIAAHEAEHDAQISAHELEHDNQMQSFENDFDSRLAGMAFTRVGTFTTGATLTDMRQTLLWEVSQGGDGREYGWTGSFSPAGKVVAAGSTPLTTGGVGAGAWVDRTDWSLRAEITPSVTEALRRSYADAGYNLVDGSFESGGTLTNTNDVLLHKASGIAYSWGGTLPITVAPNSTPTPIGSDWWIDRSAVTLRSYVTAHEAKAGAHAISGVAGLQDALDGKASATGLSSLSSSVAAIDTRVTALETRKSTCLVNAVGTGAPHETVSAALPANIAINTRYVLVNPFGANVPVIGWAEIFFNGKWSQIGFVYSDTTNGGYGVSFNFVQGEGIVIQTGTSAIATGSSSQSGGGHGIAGASVVSAPCRVFIQKLGA